MSTAKSSALPAACARVTLQATLALLAASALVACGQSDSKRILGHWRAERFQAEGISVPTGPEFEVTAHALRSLDGNVEIPISSIVAKGDDVTLEGPLSLGLSFHFEDANRISLELPFVGKLYYRRLDTKADPKGATETDKPKLPAQTSPATPTENRGVAEHAAMPGKSQPGHPVDSFKMNSTVEGMDEYLLAVEAVRQGDADIAVRRLHASFQKGFRRFDLLDTSSEMGRLKSDPRFQALMARYR